MEYTKTKAINRYNKYKANKNYCLGFIFNHKLYVYIVDELPRKNLFMKIEGKKLGNIQSLSMQIRDKDKKAWIKKGAIELGSENLLNEGENKGVAFEQLIYKLNKQKPRAKDNVPFYKAGDIEVNGTQIQIKFLNNLVRVCYSNTLYKLENKKA